MSEWCENAVIIPLLTSVSPTSDSGESTENAPFEACWKAALAFSIASTSPWLRSSISNKIPLSQGPIYIYNIYNIYIYIYYIFTSIIHQIEQPCHVECLVNSCHVTRELCEKRTSHRTSALIFSGSRVPGRIVFVAQVVQGETLPWISKDLRRQTLWKNEQRYSTLMVICW